MSTGNAYLFNALFYLPAVYAIVALTIPSSIEVNHEKLALASLLGGVKFLFSEPLVLAMVLLDFVVIGVGYFRPSCRSSLEIFCSSVPLVSACCPRRQRLAA